MKGFVYSMLYGELMIKEAEIKDRPSNGLYKNLMFARFKDNIYCMVDSLPGKVYNDVVWLEVRNDAIAFNLLIEYQEDQIIQLQEQFERRNNNIKILKESL